MSNMLHGSTFFCMAISLFGYEAGIFLRKKVKNWYLQSTSCFDCFCNYRAKSDWN